MAERFSIGEVQLGLVLFSDASLVYVRFGSASSISIESFSNAVDKLPYLRGRTRIDRALQSAADHLFSGGRPDVPQTLVLITDGRQSGDPDSLPLSEAVKKLRNKKIKIVFVGIGADVDRRELKLLADDVFFVPSFQHLKQLESKIKSILCSATGR